MFKITYFYLNSLLIYFKKSFIDLNESKNIILKINKKAKSIVLNRIIKDLKKKYSEYEKKLVTIKNVKNNFKKSAI